MNKDETNAKETTMSAKETVKASLKGMKIGETGVRHGACVTRWTADTYEVETWGRTTVSLSDAVERVLQIAVANAK